MLRVTADSNILISGLIFKRGKPFRLLQLALTGQINLTVSHEIVMEVAEVLVRKFEATEPELTIAKQIISEAARIIHPSVHLKVVHDDPDDDRIIECAVSAGSDYIVTGDQDLLKLRWYDSIRILTVSDFLELGLGSDLP